MDREIINWWNATEKKLFDFGANDFNKIVAFISGNNLDNIYPEFSAQLFNGDLSFIEFKKNLNELINNQAIIKQLNEFSNKKRQLLYLLNCLFAI